MALSFDNIRDISYNNFICVYITVFLRAQPLDQTTRLVDQQIRLPDTDTCKCRVRERTTRTTALRRERKLDTDHILTYKRNYQKNQQKCVLQQYAYTVANTQICFKRENALSSLKILEEFDKEIYLLSVATSTYAESDTL